MIKIVNKLISNSRYYYIKEGDIKGFSNPFEFRSTPTMLYKKVFQKYTVNLQKNTHVEPRFQ